jgi:Tfp pilus assembly protein PilF
MSRGLLLLRRALPAAAAVLLMCPTAPAQDEAITPEWIDQVWFNHLLKRAGDVEREPVSSEAFFRDALRVNPRSPDLVEALARLYDDQGELALAAGAAEYGRLLEPGRPFWAERSEQRWQLIAGKPLAPGEDELAAFTNQLAAANAHGLANNFMLAELGLRGLLKEFPRQSQVMLDLGRWYAQSLDWGSLTMLYAYYHHLSPDDFQVVNNYCAGLRQVGLNGPALGLLQPLIAQQPTNVYLLEQASVLAVGAGQLAQADDLAARWVAADSANAGARAAHARILIQRRRFEAARARLDEAEALQPDRQETIYLLAELAVRLGDYDTAVARLTQLRGMVGKDAFAKVMEEAPFRDDTKLQERMFP